MTKSKLSTILIDVFTRLRFTVGPPGVSAPGAFLFWRRRKRAAFFVDGYNLYHPIDKLRQNHLKWLDLWALAEEIIPSRDERVVKVVYCSAFATHRPTQVPRHRAYVAALEERGVQCAMGKFKKYHVRCNSCGNRWKKPEEKETDVNLGILLLDAAHQNEFDHVYLITADSDLAPAVRLFRRRFPKKKLTSIAPPKSVHSKELLASASSHLTVTVGQLTRNLLPQTIVCNPSGTVITRPPEYDPPP